MVDDSRGGVVTGGGGGGSLSVSCKWREMRKIGMDEVLNLDNLTGALSFCLLKPDPRHFMSFFSTHKCQLLPGIY